MKKSLMLIVLGASLSIIPNLLSAQNLKNSNLKVNYLRLPLQPLPEDVKTFSKKVTVGTLSGGRLRSSIEGKLSNALELPGFEKVEEDSDLSLYVRYSQFSIINKKYYSEKKESEDKDGKVTRWTEYYYNYEYRQPLKLVVTNNKTGEDIYSDYINNSQDYKSASTRRVRKYDDLKSAYESAIRGSESGAERGNMKQLESFLTSNFGYAEIKQPTTLREVKKYKKHDFTEFNENVQFLKLTLEKIEANDNYLTEEIKKDLGTAITYFEGQYEQMDASNKKAKINAKVGGAILQNLSVAYLWMNDFEKVSEKIELAKSVKANLWKESMKRVLDDRVERYEANGLL